MKKTFKKIFSLILIFSCLFSSLNISLATEPPTTGAYQIEGLPEISFIDRNNSNTKSVYSPYWQHWSQGASKYTNIRGNGYELVAYSKMLVEAGIEKASSFSPDEFYEWGVENGSICSDADFAKSNGRAASDYAASKKASVEYVGSVALAKDKKQDSETIVKYLKSNYYVILTSRNPITIDYGNYCETAYNTSIAYVGRAESIKANKAIIFDSSVYSQYRGNVYDYQEHNIVYLFDTLHYYKCENQLTPEEPYSVTLKTSKNYVPCRIGYYDTEETEETIYSAGTKVNIIAKTINKCNNLWYKTDMGLWIYSGNLKPLDEYTVYYDANGGIDAPYPQKFTEGSTLKLSAIYPYRTGYNFVGWATSKDSETAQFRPSANYYGKSSTLYAVWEPSYITMQLSTYNVSLSKGKVTSATVSATVKGNISDIVLTAESFNTGIATVTQPSLVSSDSQSKVYEFTINYVGHDHGFAGVNVSVLKYGTVHTSATVMVSSNTEYTITYNANGGKNAPASQKKKWNEGVTISTVVPERSGYTFMGWAESSYSSVVIYGPGDYCTANENLYLYAVWNDDYGIEYSYDIARKKLTVYGEGDISQYSPSYPAPWSECATETLTIVIDDGVTGIGSYAFYNFKQVKQITLPQTIRKIGSYAFCACTNVKEVTVPVQAIIGTKAFSQCTSLLKFGFTYNENLLEGPVLSNVGAFAFEGCSSLTEIELPDSVNEIGTGAFSECTSLAEFDFPDNVTTIEDSTFFGCSALDMEKLPDQITEINDAAFSGCTSLSVSEIPLGVTRLGDQAFSGCTAIENINVPSSISSIGAGVFSNCTSLESATVPDNLKSFGDSMFSGCTSLESCNIPSRLEAFGNGTFASCGKLDFDDEIPAAISSIGSSTFYNCTSLSDFNFNENISTIGDYAFMGCSSLDFDELPSSLASIGTAAFANCSSLSKIEIPASVTEISASAFAGCYSVSEVVFDNQEITISSRAFANCTSLSNVVIPEKAIYVAPNAFSNCNPQMTVSCYSTSAALESVTSSGVPYEVIYPVSSIEITGPDKTLKKGETAQLAAEFTPLEATNKNVTWISINEDVATVSENGLVTAASNGTAVIRAVTEDGGYSAEFEVECTVPVESITIDNKTDSVYEDSYKFFNYVVTPSNADLTEITFSSSDSSIAEINNDGIMKAVAPGKVTITVSTACGKTDSFELTVNEYIPVESITIDKAEISLNISDTIKLNATVSPANASEPDVYWYSEDDSIATVNENGNVTAHKAGTVNIFVTDANDNVSAVCSITVNGLIASVRAPSTTTINYGDSIWLHAEIEGELPANARIIWTPSNNNFEITEISADGLSCKITPKSSGDTTFTVSVVNENDNVLATDTQEMTSKAGLFRKIAAFFKKLFGTTKTYPQLYKNLF